MMWLKRQKYNSSGKAEILVNFPQLRYLVVKFWGRRMVHIPAVRIRFIALYTDAGNDTINGGTGFDYYVANYSDRTTGLTMTYDPTTGNGTITIGSEVDTLISINSFNGGYGLRDFQKINYSCSRIIIILGV